MTGEKERKDDKETGNIYKEGKREVKYGEIMWPGRDREKRCNIEN